MKSKLITSKMEAIFNNPGLKHLAEEVFWNLNAEDLKICAQINQSCKQILKKPIFCLRKFKGLSEKNKNEWIKVIQSVNNCEKGIAIISYLKWNLKKDEWIDLPCYSSPAVQNDFKQKILQSCMNEEELTDEEKEILKILLPLTDNPNGFMSPIVEGISPILWATIMGNTEIVKILAPLTENPNAPDKDGETPIFWAAKNGYTEIVRLLAPFTDNPNAPDENGNTPIYCAAYNGHTDIVKILAPLTNNPNASDKDGLTPIYCASYNGHTEIVKTLAPLTDNPNAPDRKLSHLTNKQITI